LLNVKKLLNLVENPCLKRARLLQSPRFISNYKKSLGLFFMFRMNGTFKYYEAHAGAKVQLLFE